MKKSARNKFHDGDHEYAQGRYKAMRKQGRKKKGRKAGKRGRM